MSDGTCSVDGCSKRARTRGWCNAHYERWRRSGSVGESPIGPYGVLSPCEVEGCDDNALAKMLCGKHYARASRHGDPTFVKSQKGDRNPAWRGDDIGYGAAHSRVVSARGRASDYVCVSCGCRADDWAYAHTDPNEMRAPIDSRLGAGCLYSTDPSHYQPMCKSCHIRFDAANRH